MSRFWSQTTKNIKPYVPGEQPKDRKYIKLNTNENPYPPSPRVLEAIRSAANETLRLYPDPSGDALRDAIALSFGLARENVYIGNGSDELLAFCFPAFFEPEGLPILFADVTYSFYPVYAQLFRIPYRLVPLDEQFNLSVEGYLQENGGILIANPNAPTGMGVSLESIEKILRCNDNRVVVLDEAYVDFGCESSVGLMDRFPNLLVVRTLSKSYSLAGLRVGFALGSKELIDGIIRVKDSVNSYTVDRLAQTGAREAIRDDTYFQETKSKIVRTRGRVASRLENFGFRVLPSQANFLFVSHPQTPARVLFQKLREQGILVRFFDKPRIDHFLRVSIGTDGEMDLFLEAIARICEKPAE